MPSLLIVVTGSFNIQPHHNTRYKTLSTYAKMCICYLQTCAICVYLAVYLLYDTDLYRIDIATDVTEVLGNCDLLEAN